MRFFWGGKNNTLIAVLGRVPRCSLRGERPEVGLVQPGYVLLKRHF